MFIKTKRRILNFLLRHLFNAVTEDDILVYKPETGKMYIAGQEQTYKTIEGFKTDVYVMRDLPLWQQLKKDMQHVANKKMYLNSRTTDDMIFGKAMLHTLDVIELKMNRILKL